MQAVVEDAEAQLRRYLADDRLARAYPSVQFTGLADELAALANGRGGTLVLGVDDETRQCRASRLQTW